ncbi:UNVERIFIED_CONTAM: hypothetical protein Slati_4022800 [Sesamum latifolium]|uniref:Uncharacterized protein n=1 Tax=Sesamum latifolium TaxID=2727402 RepID=A0AAW2TRJ4_9LAMI
MAHEGGAGNPVGLAFDLPDEILAVIPIDPYDQLDLARKITSMAIASRVTNLEAETGSLRISSKTRTDASESSRTTSRG